MDDPFGSVAKILLGCFLGALITHLLAKNREANRAKINRDSAAQDARANRKREFVAAVSAIRDNITTTHAALFDVHQGSLRAFKDACYRIESDVADAQAFKSAWSAYCSISKEDIESRDPNAKPPKPVDSMGNYSAGTVLRWEPPPRFEIGRKLILSRLDEVLRLAS